MSNDMIVKLDKFTINSLNFETFPIKISQEKENLYINHESRIRLRKDFKEIRHDCNVNVRSFLGQSEFRRMSFHIILLYSITLPSHILNDIKDYKNILEASRSTVEMKSDEIIKKITWSILKRIDSVT